MDSEKRYYVHPMLGVCDRSNHGEPLNNAKCADRLNALSNALESKLEYATELVTERNALEAERDRLRDCLHDFIDLADHSEGVAGWHMNGDVLTWEEIEVLTTANDLLYPTQALGGGDE